MSITLSFIKSENRLNTHINNSYIQTDLQENNLTKQSFENYGTLNLLKLSEETNKKSYLITQRQPLGSGYESKIIINNGFSKIESV